MLETPKHPSIDAFALCTSPFVAPGVIALVGMAGTWFQSGHPISSMLSLFFWQLMLAAAYAPVFFVFSIAASWLTAKLAYPRKMATKTLNIALAVGLLGFALLLQIPNIWQSTGEILMVASGVLLNALAFAWLSRAPNISFHSPQRGNLD